MYRANVSIVRNDVPHTRFNNYLDRCDYSVFKLSR